MRLLLLLRTRYGRDLLQLFQHRFNQHPSVFTSVVARGYITKPENLGTNYTTRRCCENEDAVVKLLASYGIEEVFMELLTTEQKIQYCKNAELIVGVVGGGMCNLLFSPVQKQKRCVLTLLIFWILISGSNTAWIILIS